MTTTPKYMAVQGAALLVAGGFLIVGVLGFIPGATTDYHLLEWAGHHSGAKLFGIFAVSILHNAVHLAFGIAGVVMARSYAAARAYFLGGGLVYLGLWLHGLLIQHDSPANVVPVNGADNWLHFGLGVAMMLLGLTLAGQHDPTKRRAKVRA
jgi:hypothetical protein